LRIRVPTLLERDRRDLRKDSGFQLLFHKTIETVVTSAGNIFRLGTKYTDTLSLPMAHLWRTEQTPLSAH
jgi:hypothetical protein